MITKIVLTQEDIVKIVAERYNTDQSNVWVRCFTATVGYGLGEHNEPTFEVVVNQKDEV